MQKDSGRPLKQGGGPVPMESARRRALQLTSCTMTSQSQSHLGKAETAGPGVRETYKRTCRSSVVTGSLLRA